MASRAQTLVHWLSECFREDRTRLGLTDFFQGKVELRHVLRGEERFLNGLLDEDVLPAKYAKTSVPHTHAYNNKMTTRPDGSVPRSETRARKGSAAYARPEETVMRRNISISLNPKIRMVRIAMDTARNSFPQNHKAGMAAYANKLASTNGWASWTPQMRRYS